MRLNETQLQPQQSSQNLTVAGILSKLGMKVTDVLKNILLFADNSGKLRWPDWLVNRPWRITILIVAYGVACTDG